MASDAEPLTDSPTSVPAELSTRDVTPRHSPEHPSVQPPGVQSSGAQSSEVSAALKTGAGSPSQPPTPPSSDTGNADCGSDSLTTDKSEASAIASRWQRLVGLMGFAFTVVANMASFGCFAIQGVVLARMLGPADRGVFAAIVMFPQALMYLGLLGAPELFAGYAAKAGENAPLRRSAAAYGLFAGVVSCVLCIALDLITIPNELRHVLPWAIACACTMPLQQVRLAVQAVDHGQRNFRRYNAVRLLAASSFPTLLLIGWAMGWATVSQAATIYIIAQFASFLLTQAGMDATWFGERSVSLRDALYQARGLMGAWFTTEVLERLDIVLMMVLVANEVVLGHYATAVPIAALMIIVPNAVGLYGFNRGARENELLSKSDAWRFIAGGVAVQVVCAVILGAMLPVLVPLFYGQAFEPTVRFAWLLLPAGIFRGLLQAADSYMRARKKPAIGVKARLVGLPILLIVSLAGRNLMGEAAIPIALSLAQFVCFVIVAGAVVADAAQSDSLANGGRPDNPMPNG